MAVGRCVECVWMLIVFDLVLCTLCAESCRSVGVACEDLSGETDMISLGLNSVKAAQLVGQLETRFAVKENLSEVSGQGVWFLRLPWEVLSSAVRAASDMINCHIPYTPRWSCSSARRSRTWRS
jgi:acyl carrier protein